MSQTGATYFDIMSSWLTEIVGPFMEYYSLPAIITGLFVFSLGWYLIRRWFSKG